MQTETTKTTALTADRDNSPPVYEAPIAISCARGGTISIPRNEGMTFAASSLDDAMDLLATVTELLPAYDLASSPIAGTVHTALSRVREAAAVIAKLQSIRVK